MQQAPQQLLPKDPPVAARAWGSSIRAHKPAGIFMPIINSLSLASDSKPNAPHGLGTREGLALSE